MFESIDGWEFIVPLEHAGISKPAPKTRAARPDVRFDKMNNERLKFALDLLELHQSPFLEDALREVEKRVQAGTWLDIDQPPPPLENLPPWLKRWPFRLLWAQRPR